MSIVEESAVSGWSASADVIVLGFGVAGACSALAAREQSASVLVLERGSGVSGTSTQAAGHFYLGGGTRTQLANSIEDTADDMYNYLHALTPEPEEDKIRLYCDDSVKHYNWLVQQGIPFNDGFYKDKHVEQPTDECLIWSGNEKVWPYSEQARPAPRGHKVSVEGSGGSLMMDVLTERAKTQNVAFEFDAAANALVKSGDRICGVRYKRFGEEYFVKANTAVVIAAGGYVMNSEMLAHYTPDAVFEKFWPQGNPNDDGSGITLGKAAGGCAIRMNQFFATSPIYPPPSMLNGIAVNKYGKRFINEDSYHARFAKACLEQEEGVVYLIADEKTFGRPEFGMQELLDAWDSIEEMENDLQLPIGSLQKTLAQYNADAAQGIDSEQHKHSDWLKPLTDLPYGVLQCSKGQATYTGFTLGGLKVSKDAEVLTQDGAAVPGLYAAGACASNIAQDSNGYSSGTCIGEASYFARRAAYHAVLGQAMS